MFFSNTTRVPLSQAFKSNEAGEQREPELYDCKWAEEVHSRNRTWFHSTLKQFCVKIRVQASLFFS